MPEPLRVDATMHTAEIARFTTFVSADPGSTRAGCGEAA